MKLTTENVFKVLESCLYTEVELAGLQRNEVPAGAIVVRAILSAFCFHPERIVAKREEIKSLCLQLPLTFFRYPAGRDGWSFLKLSEDTNGQQWGEHADAEVLMSLAMACGYIKYCTPRQYWVAHPGGLPYVQVDIGGEPAEDWRTGRKQLSDSEASVEFMKCATEGMRNAKLAGL